LIVPIVLLIVPIFLLWVSIFVWIYWQHRITIVHQILIPICQYSPVYDQLHNLLLPFTLLQPLMLICILAYQLTKFEPLLWCLKSGHFPFNYYYLPFASLRFVLTFDNRVVTLSSSWDICSDCCVDFFYNYDVFPRSWVNFSLVGEISSWIFSISVLVLSIFYCASKISLLVLFPSVEDVQCFFVLHRYLSCCHYCLFEVHWYLIYWCYCHILDHEQHYSYCSYRLKINYLILVFSCFWFCVLNFLL
jgi:hypothetical protein